MALEILSDLPKEAWLAFGAFAGAAATVLVGWFNLRKSGASALATERAELSEGQRAMIVLLRNEVDTLHAHVADMGLALKAERDSCDRRLKDLDAKYARETAELRRLLGQDDGK